MGNNAPFTHVLYILPRCQVNFYNWNATAAKVAAAKGMKLITDRRITEEGGENGWKKELERNGHLESEITYVKVPAQALDKKHFFPSTLFKKSLILITPCV